LTKTVKCKHKAVEDVERGEVVCNRCGEVLASQLMLLSPSDWKGLGGKIPKWKQKKAKCPKCGHEFYLISMVDNCPKCGAEVRARVEEEDAKEVAEVVDVKLRKVTVKWLRLSVAKRVVAKHRVYYRQAVTKCMAVTVTFTYRRKKRALILPWTLIEKILPSIYAVWTQKRRGPRVRDSKKIAKAVRAIHRELTAYGLPNATTVTAALVKLTERRVQQLLSAKQKSRSHVERGRKARKRRKVKKAKKSRR